MTNTANAEILDPTDDEGFVVTSADDVLLDAQIGHLLGLDAQIEALQERRDGLAAIVIEAVQGKPDWRFQATGAQVAVVEAETIVCDDLDALEAATSRRLFAKLTKRAFDVKAYRSHLAAGTFGIERAAAAVRTRTSKPSLRITKR